MKTEYTMLCKNLYDRLANAKAKDKGKGNN